MRFFVAFLLAIFAALPAQASEFFTLSKEEVEETLLAFGAADGYSEEGVSLTELAAKLAYRAGKTAATGSSLPVQFQLSDQLALEGGFAFDGAGRVVLNHAKIALQAWPELQLQATLQHSAEADRFEVAAAKVLWHPTAGATLALDVGRTGSNASLALTSASFSWHPDAATTVTVIAAQEDYRPKELIVRVKSSF